MDGAMKALSQTCENSFLNTNKMGPMRVVRACLAYLMALVLPMSDGAFATSTYCAVVGKTPDGFLNVRVGPGVAYGVIARLLPSDFVYVDTGSCKAGLCDEARNWQFVEGVPRLDGNKEPLSQGWVHSKYIKQVGCPNEVYDGSYSAIAAGSTAWEIVGRHHTLEKAREAAIGACSKYAEDSEACSAVTAGPNEHYFVAATCDKHPYTHASKFSCNDAITNLNREAAREGRANCKVFNCEQGGGGWPHGRY